jgi:hypothetical protein
MKIAVWSLFAVSLSAGSALAGPPSLQVAARHAAPPAPPVEIVVGTELSDKGQIRAASTLYSIGEPTPEEQLYLEMINRARANPAAEGLLFANTADPLLTQDYADWHVDLALMQSQFALIQPAPPLAMSAALSTAARSHTLDMFNNAFQDHKGTDGSSFSQRINSAGYKFSMAAENIFSYAGSVFHGHAGFEVDWGPGTGGMQTPPGHRENIHNSGFREVGVGVIVGRNEVAGKQAVGPQVVTQDFGTAQGTSLPFITGVAFYDLNGNDFYDLNEGIGGVSVTVSGANYQAITALSGGYAVPVPGDGTYNVTFSGAGFSPVTQTVTITNRANRKVDFKPTYAPPLVAGTTTPSVFRPNAYVVSTVGGAESYQWRVFQKTSAATQGAENGTGSVQITQTGDYDVIESGAKQSGSFAFHLVTPGDDARSQYIRLLPTYLPRTNSSLIFQSRLGWAAPDQHAQVQISADNGANWQTVYDQDGTGGQSDTAFVTHAIDLSPFADQFIQVQFVYAFNGGQFFDQSDLSVGWVFDEISFSNTSEIQNEQITDFSGGSFDFEPQALASYSLQARAKTGSDFLPWGPALSVRAVQATGTPEVGVNQISTVNGQLRLNFTIMAGATPTSMVLESTSGLQGSWTVEGATPEDLGNGSYAFQITPAGPRRFYRIRAN